MEQPENTGQPRMAHTAHTTDSNAFIASATVAIQDIHLQTALDRSLGGADVRRLTAWGETTDAQALRQQGRNAKLRALQDLPEMLELLEANLTARGVKVLWAVDGAECNQHVLDIARANDVQRIVKGKSMATEETHLNDALEAAGLEVTETDLGEFVVQIAHERPSHIVSPILHKTKEQVSDLFVEHLHIPPSDDPKELAYAARLHLRQKFIHADMGITGANFAIAETGTLAIVTNEGNGRMCSSLPRVHVVVVGIEKIVPTVADFATLVQMLARSTGGQRITTYVHMMGGPARPEEPDGPDQMYVILLDNGRSRIHGSEYAEVLACIRCGACLNTCPVYQNVGGHAYGGVYSGPIGAVITPLLNGLAHAAPLPHASSLCGACKAACPVDIDLPGKLLKLRGDLVDDHQADPLISATIKGWAAAMQQPRLYALGAAAAQVATRAAAGSDGAIHALPGMLGHWTQNRDFPPFAPQSFHQLWQARKKQGSTHE
jgi:L-lactate dehydrogenase complex protein LldF